MIVYCCPGGRLVKGTRRPTELHNIMPIIQELFPDSKDSPGPCDITLGKAGFVDLTGFHHSFFGISSVEAFHVSPIDNLESASNPFEDEKDPPLKPE